MLCVHIMADVTTTGARRIGAVPLTVTLLAAAVAGCSAHHSAPRAESSNPPARPVLNSSARAQARHVATSAVVLADRQRSAHVAVALTDARQTLVGVGDITTDRATLRLTLNNQHADVRVTPTAAYVDAPAGIWRALGASASVADRLQQRWVSVAPADAPYKVLAQSFTLHGILASTTTRGRTAPSAVTSVAGKPVTAWTGRTASGSVAAWFVDASTKEAIRIAVSGPASRRTFTFSKWNEPVTVETPRATARYP